MEGCDFIQVEVFIRNDKGELFEAKNNMKCFLCVPKTDSEYRGFSSKDVIIVHHDKLGLIDSIELVERYDTKGEALKVKDFVYKILKDKKDKMIERRALGNMIKSQKMPNEGVIKLLDECNKMLRNQYFEIHIRDAFNQQ